MASIIRFRRGTTLQHQNFVGLLGEITIDTTKKTVVAHDGVTPGGSPLLTESVFNAFSSNVYTKTQVDQLISEVSLELGNITLAEVAITGDYSHLSNKPVLSNVAISGNYNDLLDRPNLHPVAISGSYADLTGVKPTANVAFTNSYSDLSGKPTFANVAFSGNYLDLINRPEFDSDIYVTQAQLNDSLSNYATISSLNNYVLNTNLLSAGTAAGLASQLYVNQQDNILANIIATKADSSALSNYVTTTSLSSTLSSYVTTTSLNSALANYVESSSLETTLSPYTKVVPTVPAYEEGQPGDKRGMIAFDNNYMYVCVEDWVSPGTNVIWKRIAWFDTIIGS